MEPVPVYTTDAIKESGLSSFLVKVFAWMTLGLAMTAGVAAMPIIVLGEEKFMELLSQYIIFIYVAMGLELLIVFGLSFLINKLPPVVAFFAFFIYAALNGITLSPIFIVYTNASIAATFMICSMMFGAMAVFGYVTKMDLSKVGAILVMALIGLIIASIVNIFLNATVLEWIISVAGIIIFCGLTAWDVQKIKGWGKGLEDNTVDYQRASIMGALMLYLDFINLFLFLLRIMGRRD